MYHSMRLLFFLYPTFPENKSSGLNPALPRSVDVNKNVSGCDCTNCIACM